MSGVLHAAILAWALISIQSPREFQTPVIEPVAVSIVTTDELTRLKKGARSAKRKDAVAKVKPKKKTAKKTPKRPKPVRAAVAPPPPDPIAETLKKQAEAKKLAEKKTAAAAKKKKVAAARKRAIAKKKAAAKRKKAAARKKALAKKRRLARARKRKDAARRKRLAALAAKKKKLSFEPDKISALLNKDPRKSVQAPAVKLPAKSSGKKNRAGLGAPEGKDDRLTASEIEVLKSAISAQLKNCWSLPGGGGGSEVPIVTLSWRLRPDGSLSGEPRVQARRSGVIFQVYAEAAKNAVRRCAPFRLPRDKYKAWSEITWEFDPSQLL